MWYAIYRYMQKLKDRILEYPKQYLSIKVHVNTPKATAVQRGTSSLTGVVSEPLQGCHCIIYFLTLLKHDDFCQHFYLHHWVSPSSTQCTLESYNRHFALDSYQTSNPSIAYQQMPSLLFTSKPWEYEKGDKKDIENINNLYQSYSKELRSVCMVFTN